MQKPLGQRGFADALTEHLRGRRTADFLDALETAVPWEELVRPLEQLLAREPGTAGASHYPAATMFKATMLAKWYGLSDPQLEEQLRDRLSLRRFVGLSLEDPTPDETSFVRFRARLREANLEAVLFERCLKHLEGRGLVVKEGTLVDATILAAPAPRPRKQDRQASGSSGGGGDPEGSYTLKNGQIHYGYKAHVATDRRGLVTGYVLDTAKVHDVNHLLTLTAKEPSGGAVFADSAYLDQQRQAKLHRRGVFTGIIAKRRRGQAKLPAWQRALNRAIASIRAAVEWPFAWMKNRGYRRVRYRGLERNRLDLSLMLVAHNLARSLRLRPPEAQRYVLNLPPVGP